MRRHLTDSRRGTVATGASATGAASFGALTLGAAALGALAVGALAVGALAVGRLSVGRARLRRVEIGELAVGWLAVGTRAGPGVVTEVARIRAAPGMGDALARALSEEMARNGHAPAPLRAHRSRADPDLFLLQSLRDDAGAHAAPAFDAFLRDAARRRLIPTASGEPVGIESYEAI
ncbi:hypothetical protein [Amaricoccus solimangrovi]|uniref:hypothetical protein n=1 Tax=Amaricoccus solimangrovi TaxID=2589815 RepID=UPI001AEEBF07|nr:hypothetical protein [Amaricoccus solimangrovi]